MARLESGMSHSSSGRRDIQSWCLRGGPLGEDDMLLLLLEK